MLDDLRTRTGVLLAASFVATSFHGGGAIAAGGSIVVVFARRAFARLVAASVVIRVQQRSQLHRGLAYDLHRSSGANDTRARPCCGAFQILRLVPVVDIALLLVLASGAPVQRWRRRSSVPSVHHRHHCHHRRRPTFACRRHVVADQARGGSVRRHSRGCPVGSSRAALEPVRRLQVRPPDVPAHPR